MYTKIKGTGATPVPFFLTYHHVYHIFLCVNADASNRFL